MTTYDAYTEKGFTRRTTVVNGRLASKELKLKAARQHQHGLQIMSINQLASRLSGGFSCLIDGPTLTESTREVLPDVNLDDLNKIKDLPGLADAAASSLQNAWNADIDLTAKFKSEKHPRLKVMARLETAVLDTLPKAMMRPAELVASARKRLAHSKELFGPIDMVGFTDLDPVWRPLMLDVASQLPVQWHSATQKTPDWIKDSSIEIVSTEPQNPDISVVSAANPYHEAVEAMRWTRELLSSGKAKPSEIAIASVSTRDYDDSFFALREEAGLDVHFVHQVKVTNQKTGQMAAALADILHRGLSQTRVRRLYDLTRMSKGAFNDLPSQWTKLLPPSASLTTPNAWHEVIEGIKTEDWQGKKHNPKLRRIIDSLSDGIEAVSVNGDPEIVREVGKLLLPSAAYSIWHRMLKAGSIQSLELTLSNLRHDDGFEPCTSVCWMPAGELASSPRRFVRLIGLNASRWPRGISHDQLLPNHVIPTREMNPIPNSLSDQQDFESILSSTESEVVLSFARYANDGRTLPRSLLLSQGDLKEKEVDRLASHATPAHAFSETDRLMARPLDFRKLPQAKAALKCWKNWHKANLTPHDGVIGANHPLIKAVLQRPLSATSLKPLLRNPIGFLWKYGLGWKEPGDTEAEPLTLESASLGSIVHEILELAVSDLEAGKGFASAGERTIKAAIKRALKKTRKRWESEELIPPSLIWEHALEEITQMCVNALTAKDDNWSDAKSYPEASFGGMRQKSEATSPWDVISTVTIPGTKLQIRGSIDRLDISADGKQARVIDYKTGMPPKPGILKKGFEFDGGKELQRCLYAAAVSSLLGSVVSVEASLLYVKDELTVVQLEDPGDKLKELAKYLNSARTNLINGGAVMGEDIAGTYDDMVFALPANTSSYLSWKESAAYTLLGSATAIWEAK